MNISLAPGDYLLDFAGFRLDAAAKVNQAKAGGCKGVLRYSAGAASSPSNSSHGKNAYKLITPAEHHALLADGFDIIANDEWYPGRMLEGPSAGTEDGKIAAALWESCGHAKGSHLYCSLDKAAGVSSVPALVEYLTHFQSAGGNYYVADFYGGTPLIRALVAAHLTQTYGWRPNAGSWSGDGLPYQPANARALLDRAQKATPAHIWQTGNYWFGKEADENLVLRVPVGSHLEAAAKPPVPTPPKPPAPKPPTITHGPGYGHTWPNWMKPGNYFGLITGPATSHGGASTIERNFVKLIQEQLIWAGYVPGIHTITSGWADGIFGPPTAAAVAAFQHHHMPGTKFYGEVWSDDWHTLMALSRSVA